MGVLQRITDGLQVHRELTGRRETYADYRRIVHEQSGGRLSLNSIYSDLTPVDPAEYMPGEGEFLFFRYSPKYKDDLTIYDIYPFVYVLGQTETVEIGTSAFYGANLHYINKAKAGDIRNTIYADDTIIKTFDHDMLLQKDFELMMKNLLPIIYLNEKFNIIQHTGASLYHKYIQSYIQTRMYLVPEYYANIMLFLELERFVTQ